MLINNLGNNKVVVTVKDSELFFSYNTPVAAQIDGKYYKTDKFFSVTTRKHINQFIGEHVAEIRPQKFFDTLGA